MNFRKFKMYTDCIYKIIKPRNLKWVAEIAVAKKTFAVRLIEDAKETLGGGGILKIGSALVDFLFSF